MLQAPNWLYFPEQWDPKSPWHDLRVRQAANLAIDREGMNKALFLGYCKITNSIVPDTFEYYWQPPPAVYDPAKAKKLLAEAGYPERLRRRPVVLRQLLRQHGARSRSTISRQIGIRAKLQPIERAGFFAGYADKKLHRGIIQRGERRVRQRRDPARRVRRQGRRLRLWQLSRHRRAVPAAGRRARPRRSAAAILDKMQQLVHEKAIYRADLAARLPQRRRPAGRRVGLRR